MIGENKIWRFIGYDLNKAQSLLGKTRSLNRKDYKAWQDKIIWKLFIKWMVKKTDNFGDYNVFEKKIICD